MSPAPPRIPFDRAVEYYDDTRGFPSEVAAELARTLVEELGDRSTLEVGVGTARIAAPLVGQGPSVVGVDLSRPMLRRALAKGLASGVRADGARLPFQDRAFDVAITVHLTHLLADWARVLREICRVTRTEYLSILEGPEPRGGPASEYYRALSEEGFPASHPGLHERRLAQMLPPDRSLSTIAYTERTSTGAILDILERRQWSNQWAVPDGPHRRALQHARARFPVDREIEWPAELRIAIWSIERLAEFARKTGARGPSVPT